MHIQSPDTQSLSLSASAQNLQRLVVIRGLLILGLCAAFGIAYWGMQLMMPYQTLLLLLGGLTAINTVTWARTRNPWPVTEMEFFSQLVIDIAGIGLLLFFAGGASNPFVSYFLVPLTIAAATLPWAMTAAIALLSLSAYTLLLFYNVPLPDLAPPEAHSHHGNGGLNTHIIGMWFNFLLSASLITYFVVKMANALREQQQQLAEHREDELRNEQLMAVATLAAGTAHELGTPLSTMKVLLNEMQSDYCGKTEGSLKVAEGSQKTSEGSPKAAQGACNMAEGPTDPVALKNDIHLLQQQVHQCTETLRQLVNKAEQTKDGDIAAVDIRQFCSELLERWLVMRPNVAPTIHINPDAPELSAHLHPTIAQSIINLLNNAADANPDNLQITIDWSQTELAWDIRDQGPGIPLELADQFGKAFITTKGKGLGLGLFLTHATLTRYGGCIKLFNRDEGGTLTELRLPLERA